MSKLQKLTRKVFEKTGYLFLGASKKIYKSEQEKMYTTWVKDQGDELLRVTYDLDKDSLVFDIGGYKGQWASDIYAKYNCTIHVFEPVQSFAQKIEERFKNNSKIILHDFGLGQTTADAQITIDNDASSLHRHSCRTTGNNSQTIKIVDIDDFIKQNNIHHIDLMKMNIEGGEYELLDRIIETGLIDKIQNVQIQFHDFVPQADKRRQALAKVLSETHEITYQYPLIWENWQRKK